jgi:Transposase, Mutator family
MATPSMDITSFVGKLLEQDDVDALREGVRVLAQAVMETEVSGQIGAAPYERSTERTAYRNGYRTRRWDTRVGTIELKIACRRPSWASEITRCTPFRPRLTSWRRNEVQNWWSSEAPVAAPSTVRSPCSVTPIATTVATETTRPASRTLWNVASSHR